MKKEFRKALTRAFVRLRAYGYFASHNFACCMSCSWDEISDDQAVRAVFYHDQDKQEADRSDELYLVWQGDPVLIRSILQSEGLVVIHDGSVQTRIRVKMP